MKLKVYEIGDGLHSSEVWVRINTKDGEEGLVLDKRSLHGNSITIGYPIRISGDSYLVELPRETSSGNWRVWVNKKELEANNEKELA